MNEGGVRAWELRRNNGLLKLKQTGILGKQARYVNMTMSRKKPEAFLVGMTRKGSHDHDS